MTAKDLIAEEIIPLHTSDTGEEALSIMSDFSIQHLPIVDNKELLGLVSESDVLDYGVDEPVGSYPLSIQKPYVMEHAHIYEVATTMTEHRLTVLPVVDSQRRYLGLISQGDLLANLARIGSFSEPGGILILRMSKQDYSLAQIARIAESENVVILSSWVYTLPDSTLIEVTLKLNRQNIQALIASYERFDFEVMASFAGDEISEMFRERYDSLIRYLNV